MLHFVIVYCLISPPFPLFFVIYLNVLKISIFFTCNMHMHQINTYSKFKIEFRFFNFMKNNFVLVKKKKN